MANELSIESLESAFNAPAPEAKRPETPAPDGAADTDEAALEATLAGLIATEEDAGTPIKEAEAPAEDAEAKPAEAEPEFEIEVNGEKQLVRGKAEIITRLQQATDYAQKSEQNARARDALVAQIKIQQDAQHFQAAVMDDIAALRAYDQQLEQWARVDWTAAYDADPFNALKLREQRDQLREARQAKFQELDAKHSQFKQGQAQAAQQLRYAEEQALLAKLPEWRNSEKATGEKQAMWQMLNSAGFNNAEIESVMDHRMLVVARKAMLWDQLQRTARDRTKQVRDAPPVVKPGAVVPSDKGQSVYKKAVVETRKLGRQGNHKGQEALVQQMLNRAFK